MTTELRHKELQDNLAAYPISMLQDFITFMVHCKKLNIKTSDIALFIKTEIENGNIEAQKSYERGIAIKKIMAEKMPYCPVCNTQLRLEPINNHPARIIDDHSKCWWVCPGESCEFDPVLSDQEPWKVIGDLGIPVYNIPKTMTPQKRAKRMRAAGRQRGCGKKG